ncbi:MAG: undecaprenyl diphosphate synthase family protein [Planctomycetota bacterium]|nr:undecaprenyl diphosphate synthase family protein [Planctomycetota bacterium]MDI6786971.1 undecaprenyl diphosphate synthase family protein [Planctomycetota bacterium]
MNLPNHIAIIMDGNGRWAKEKGLSRIKGHQKGAEIVDKIVREASHWARGTLPAGGKGLFA